MVTIYEIRCQVNGKVYIGCTRSKVSKRLREHRCLLRAGKHTCEPFQQDYIAHGDENFDCLTLEIFEDDSVETRRAKELKWMDVYGERLYNARFSFRPPDGAQARAAAARVANGYRQSPESNLKRRLAQLGVPKGHGAKISATKQARNK